MPQIARPSGLVKGGSWSSRTDVVGCWPPLIVYGGGTDTATAEPRCGTQTPRTAAIGSAQTGIGRPRSTSGRPSQGSPDLQPNLHSPSPGRILSRMDFPASSGIRLHWSCSPRNWTKGFAWLSRQKLPRLLGATWEPHQGSPPCKTEDRQEVPRTEAAGFYSVRCERAPSWQQDNLHRMPRGWIRG